MLYGTGDCHGDFGRLATRRFPLQRELNKDDCVMIMGDAALCWDASRREEQWLDWLEAKPFTTVNVGGNHENYALLERYPKVPWRGGMAWQLRPSVLQLCRGYVFRINGKRVFVMGGAQTHDTEIILPAGADPAQRKRLKRRGASYRVEGETWWPRELPDASEYRRALDALEREDWMVDLVCTHCAPTAIQRLIAPASPENDLTDFLQTVREKLVYRRWYCGHYHREWSSAEERFQVLHEEITVME